ncbi:maintenance of mitochondrial morphology protein 1 [Parastagonospora nodorum SN15]|uniref:Maintenance of mitochondrial morphology protein 1 n=1 Tax=Phaeosphaeria nodorum (strain SN15 / ATCC MYA-4574 / FGSC 10173) TaxID=321614 RepID=A0A7U2I469_PHANO|nr:maintenance of mitochondrial morphology protein 1 [Parastagonospora nodorum SN15]
MATQVATPLSPPTPQSSSSLSFTQGFLLGQLSIALLIFFFIKFFIFGEPPSADDRSLHLNSLRRARTLAHQQSIKQLRTRSNSISLSLRHKDSRSIIRKGEETRGGPSIATILAKTYYNVKGHQPESLDWFNVLIAQTIAQLRADARQDDAILGSLTEVLNSGSKPDWIGEIKVNEIALGDEFPIFSNCRVMPAEDGFWYGPGTTGTEEGRLQARMDVDLSDVITIGIETTLNLNWPKPLSAVLPVALAVSIVRFSGTLALSFIPSSSPPSTSTTTPNPEHHRSNSTTSSSTSPHTAPPPSPSPSSTTTASTSPCAPSSAPAHACKTCPRSPSSSNRACMPGSTSAPSSRASSKSCCPACGRANTTRAAARPRTSKPARPISMRRLYWKKKKKKKKMAGIHCLCPRNFVTRVRRVRRSKPRAPSCARRRYARACASRRGLG